ncbi:MAG: hypothetical protein ACI86M_001440 [Saprospiraceae bacterium]|jgi:hypothetical protein
MKHIDKVFRDKLYNQKKTVPDGMWDKIVPALEEKSGRSMLWFWFVGIMTLIIGGLAYLLINNNQVDNTSTAPLAMELPIQKIQTSTPLSQTLALSDDLTKTSIVEQIKSNKTKNRNTIVDSQKPLKNRSAQQKLITKTHIAATSVVKLNTNSTVSNNTDNLYGKPANLVITKSYLSDNGSIIEKSNPSKGTEISQPSYNVFISSEGLNAGALLRIIEPLENIPLPAFSTDLKKKIIL